MLKKLLSQIATLVIVSCLFGVLFITFNSSFFVGVGFGIVIQFALYYGYVTTLNTYTALQNKKLENERIKEFSLQSLEVVCPCYKQVKEIVPIRLNTDNKYKCSECSKAVSVFITPETAIVTEPILNTDITLLNKNITEKLTNANT